MKKYDVIIIGFGKAGKTLAGNLASAGKTTALIERSEMMYGGTCINVGCIPSKSFVHSAELSASMGGSFAEKSARYTEAVREKRRLTKMLRDKNFHKLADRETVDVIDGTASFIGPHSVQVQTNGGQIVLSAEKIVINTGASPILPNISGIRESRHVYTSETLLELEHLPERLVIIGGGYIGMEFASIYANFGAEVTVIQRGSVFLPREDREIADAVFQRLKRMGVHILLSAQTQAIQDKETQALVTVQTEEGERNIYADAVLTAAGRKPNIEELKLENAGVAVTERGAIQVDSALRTTAEGIWAAGDVTGGLQFTYISLDDSRIIESDFDGGRQRSIENRGTVPYSVFLDPPFSRAGMSEQEARQAGYHVKIARLPASAIPKAQVLKQTEGLLKAVIDADTNQILGAHLFCAESHELINLVRLAIDLNLPYTVLRDNIYTHPTMSEALNDLFAVIDK